jgi:hypothetical protein
VIDVKIRGCSSSGADMKANLTTSARLAAVVITSSLLVLLPESAAAQEKQKYLFSVTVPSKYIEQHVLEVGDLPGHQIRIAALETKYETQAPSYDGVKVTESSGWLRSDYINRSGGFTQYSVLQMANGDKIYQTLDGQSQTSYGPEGSGKTSYTTVIHLTGGTGKFAKIRGILRGSGVTDFKTGAINSPVEGEYWFDK